MPVRFPLALALLFAFAIACSRPSGQFFYGALGLGEGRIVVATQNTGARTIVTYDMNGKLGDIIADYTAANEIPKGIAPFDAFSIAVLVDGVDRLARASLIGASEVGIATDAALTGNLWHLAWDELGGRYFALEGNNIEAFTREGQRLGNPFIPNNLAPCTINVARDLAVTAEGILYVVGTGNDDLLAYDTTTTPVTCLTANTTMGNIDPVAVIKHSNGQVYVATQGDDRIYAFPADASSAGTAVWNTNIGLISNPTALLELPDGSILVASDGTNSIVRISPTGELVDSGIFIRDAFTGAVTQMLYLEPQ